MDADGLRVVVSVNRHLAAANSRSDLYNMHLGRVAGGTTVRCSCRASGVALPRTRSSFFVVTRAVRQSLPPSHSECRRRRLRTGKLDAFARLGTLRRAIST